MFGLKECIMATNDIRKASLWHALWSLYRMISLQRSMLGLRLSTAAGASWCGKRFAVICVRGNVKETSRTDPKSREPCGYRRRPGVSWKALDTVVRKLYARCGIGSIDLSFPGRSSRHLRRGHVV